MTEYLHKNLTEAVIYCFYRVYNTLGFGFLEKVYENALILELLRNGIKLDRQKPIKVYYLNDIIGDYFADIVVEDKLIIELKAADCLIEEHELQLINYLKATDMEVGLLLNFGIKPEIRRKIFTNNKKHISPVKARK